ncbi:MAG: beta-lactamase family protein [Gemmatimonadota bacterium]|nr:beta-lactamase family protein [Gemmatimonadota bacterium]MDH4351954.1 beta-lactamase family protein [Gemmatimonadota bacterium]MDH5197103.1 beta-lactamase family protein [Gemmatimonadota bacterium]
MQRSLTALAISLLVTACAGGPRHEPPWPTDGWTTARAESQGLDPVSLEALHDAITAGAYGYVDRLVVVKNGYLVFSGRYPQDYRAVSRGHRSAIGCGWESCTDANELHEYNYLHPDFHPWFQGRELHTLQSVTKSIAATLVGVGIAQGQIPGVQTPFLSYLDEYDLTHVDPRLRTATLADLLTMRSGIEWHETDRPLDSTNTTARLEWAGDWVQFTLDQPMDADPGTKWAYNSGGSHLLSAIIRDATGLTIDAYAERHLFGPLGIHDYYWKYEPMGLPDTEGGLYLEAEQLAKIGYLYLNDGVWDGVRLLPEGWVDSATARQVDRVGVQDWGYGYQWWRLDRHGTVIWAGLGFGGQYLLVFPERELIAVVNSWNLFGDDHQNVLAATIDALLPTDTSGARP